MSFLLEAGLSNTLFALVIAVLALIVHRWGRAPRLAHLLWLIVLIRLVTPPVLALPWMPGELMTIESSAPAPIEFSEAPIALEDLDPVLLSTLIDATADEPAVAPEVMLHPAARTGLVLWLFGSTVVLVTSLMRIIRFNRLLHTSSCAVPESLQQLTNEMAERLHVRRVPELVVTSADVSPMVWWCGGSVRIVVSSSLAETLPREELRWILAHELAHVRRRDHFTRWLEWLTCVAFWWNPLSWWARRNLRINEEMCCDALVLSSLQPEPRVYAQSLMAVLEFLAAPALRPPAVASEANGGGFLERRFRMIVTRNVASSSPRWLRAAILAGTVALLPIGLASADGPPSKDMTKATEKKQRSHGDAVLDALARAVAMDALDEKMAYELYRMTLQKKRDAMIESGSVSAEEFDAKVSAAIEHSITTARIRQSVADGKLSEHDAEAKLDALRARAEAHRVHTELEIAVKKLHEAVEAGEISEEEARVKYESLKRLGEQKAADLRERHARAQAEGDAIAARLRKAVEDGTMSKEEAAATYERLKSRIDMTRAHERDQIQAHLETMAAKIHKAVEDGILSEEEAASKMAELKQKLHEVMQLREDQALLMLEYQRLSEEYKKRVAEGDLSALEAEKRLHAIAERIHADKAHAEEKAKQKPKRSELEEAHRAALERIERALKHGEMTKAEAEEHLHALMKKIHGDRR